MCLLTVTVLQTTLLFFKTEKTIITGIAKPFPFISHLKKENDLVLQFSDHHNFTEKEIDNIKKVSNKKPIENVIDRKKGPKKSHAMGQNPPKSGPQFVVAR